MNAFSENPTNSTKTLIIGVGNPLRRDDGIGIEVIKKLQNVNLQDVELYDGGTDGLALLDVISFYPKAIIVDAVNMDLPPATIKAFTPQEAIINIKNDTLSTHGFGLAEVIKFMEQLDIKTNLIIVGVQPQDISFGEGLTIAVANVVDQVVALVKEKI